jgi:hypothetical protein
MNRAARMDHGDIQQGGTVGQGKALPEGSLGASSAKAEVASVDEVAVGGADTG